MKGETGKYTITQRITASGISEVEISGIRPGIADIDVEALDSGIVIASEKIEISIPQFIVINESNPDFDAFINTNNLGAVQDVILDEAKLVMERLLLSNANVRLIWASGGVALPAHIPLSMITHVNFGNADPSGRHRYGTSGAGPGGGGVGDTSFDEVVFIFPASYLVNAVGSDIDQTTNQLVQAIMSIQQSDPVFEAWEIKSFGRLLGETMSHEIYHCLLLVAFEHNVDASNIEFDSADLMDAGEFRSFRERTGIDALDDSFRPDQILNQLNDNGIGTINVLTDTTLGRNLSFIHSRFPIPPTPPFNI